MAPRAETMATLASQGIISEQECAWKDTVSEDSLSTTDSQENHFREVCRMMKVHAFLAQHGFRSVNAPKKFRRCLRTCVTYAVHTAAEANDAAVLRELLANGANPGAVDSKGRTALQLAESLNTNGSHNAVIRCLQPKISQLPNVSKQVCPARHCAAGAFLCHQGMPRYCAQQVTGIHTIHEH